jgi:hypothetical protein
MQFPRTVVSFAITGLLVAACGGAAPPTAGPDGVTPTANPGGGQGTPTQAPVATPDGGGGGVLPGNGSGKVNFEISGPVQKSGELPFFGAGSRFSGPAGVSLQFTRTDSSATEIVSIFPDLSDSSKWLVSYVSDDGLVSATACTMSNLQLSDTNASGAFDCPNSIVTKADGTYATDGRIRGTFEAHAT